MTLPYVLRDRRADILRRRREVQEQTILRRSHRNKARRELARPPSYPCSLGSRSVPNLLAANNQPTRRRVGKSHSEHCAGPIEGQARAAEVRVGLSQCPCP